MCGIVGVAGDLWGKEEQVFKRQLIFDYLRGPDSTGLGAVRNDGTFRIAKTSSHPIDLMEMSRFKDALNGNQSKAFIGHNRLATRGMVNTYNAHPFEFGDVLGVHNGTLDTFSVTKLEEAIGDKFPVDSMALIAGINVLGLKDTIALCSGAWSIAYYDRRDDTFNLLRNKERPMTYCYTKDFKKLLFASEYPMIMAPCQLVGGYEFYSDKDGNEFFSTEEDIHYRWDLAELKKGGVDIPKPKVCKVKGKETVVTGPHSDTPFTFRPGSSQSGTSTSNSGTMSLSKTSPKTGRPSTHSDRIQQFVGRPDNPFSGIISEEEFAGMTKRGCSYCFKPLVWGERGIAVYQRDEVVLGPCCSGHPDKNRVYSKFTIYA